MGLQQLPDGNNSSKSWWWAGCSCPSWCCCLERTRLIPMSDRGESRWKRQQLISFFPASSWLFQECFFAATGTRLRLTNARQGQILKTRQTTTKKKKTCLFFLQKDIFRVVDVIVDGVLHPQPPGLTHWPMNLDVNKRQRCTCKLRNLRNVHALWNSNGKISSNAHFSQAGSFTIRRPWKPSVGYWLLSWVGQQWGGSRVGTCVPAWAAGSGLKPAALKLPLAHDWSMHW